MPISMSEALAEAYASEPVDEFIYHTLELIHPAFTNEYGLPTTVRLVQGTVDGQFGLENSAPFDAGQTVKFTGIPFDLTQNGFAENEVPTLVLAISNVNRIVAKYLEEAIAETDPIVVIYRHYLESDKAGPQLVPVIIMSLSSAEMGLMQLTATASLSDVHNFPFPNIKYTPDTFPGLLR